MVLAENAPTWIAGICYDDCGSVFIDQTLHLFDINLPVVLCYAFIIPTVNSVRLKKVFITIAFNCREIVSFHELSINFEILPGFGINTFWPGLAIAEMHISIAAEAPLHNIISSAVTFPWYARNFAKAVLASLDP